MNALAYDTHRCIVDPLTIQRHIKYQLFTRVIKLLHSIKNELRNTATVLLGNAYLAL